MAVRKSRKMGLPDSGCILPMSSKCGAKTFFSTPLTISKNFESIWKIFGNYLGILVAILNTALHEYSTGNPYTLFSAAGVPVQLHVVQLQNPYKFYREYRYRYLRTAAAAASSRRAWLPAVHPARAVRVGLQAGPAPLPGPSRAGVPPGTCWDVIRSLSGSASRSASRSE